jgi:hypothetical protein
MSKRCYPFERDGALVKECTKCHLVLSVDEFNKKAGTKVGFRPWCKLCYRQWEKSYEQTTKGKEKRRRSNTSAKGKFSTAKSKANKDGKEWTIRFEDYDNLIKNNCHYCQGPLNTFGCGLDRKDSSIGYVLENVVPCCSRCNTTFSDLYTYQEKMLLAVTIRLIDSNRSSTLSQEKSVG